jgi:predicted enzyme related to lactoylglutathione lyase
MKARDFFGSDANITVRDPEACKGWYQNLFDARQLSVKDLSFDPAEQEGCVFLGWSKNDPVLCLFSGDPADATVAVITCEDLGKAANYLTRKGVTVSPIQQDRAGTKFFEIRDCEGNTIEFCEEN